MLTSRKRLWQDRLAAIRHYYRSPKFALIDLLFGCIALFFNPYRTCRKFLQKQGAENIYAYGETPFTTYQKIIFECDIAPHDTWVELGAGRGKGCFWLAHFTKCQVIGIEQIPQFVFWAKLLQKLFRLPRLSFQRRAIEEIDLPHATVFYLYGTAPPPSFPPQAKIISISEPLPHLPLVKTFWVRYPWGRTTAFLQTT